MSFQTCMSFFLLCNILKDVFCVLSLQWKSGGLVLFINILYYFVCHGKKVSHAGLEHEKKKNEIIFIFWVSYPFNIHHCSEVFFLLVYYAHQDCIYLIKNTVKTVRLTEVDSNEVHLLEYCTSIES